MRTPRRPKSTRTPRRASPTRPTCSPRSSSTATARWSPRSSAYRARRPAHVPARQPDECAVHQRERRGAPTRAQPRGAGRERRDGDLVVVPTQLCTALVEDGGSQLLTFSIDLPSRAYGPYPVLRAGSRRSGHRGGRAVSVAELGGTPVPGTVTRMSSARRRCLVATVGQWPGWRCWPGAPRRAAGHLAARRRQRPEDPRPAVAGVRHRRCRRADRVRGRRLVRVSLPRPRPADPEADPRPAGAGDRLDDPAGADPHRCRHPDRRHDHGPAETDDTECVVNVTGQQWWWEIDYPAQDGCLAAGSPSRSSRAASS